VSWNSRRRPYGSVLYDVGGEGRCLLGSPALLPRTQNLSKPVSNPGVRRISAGAARPCVNPPPRQWPGSARCSSGSAVNCSAPAKSHESIFASIAPQFGLQPRRISSGSSTRKPGRLEERARISRVVFSGAARPALDLREIRLTQATANLALHRAANSCWVIVRPKPRSEPSTARGNEVCHRVS